MNEDYLWDGRGERDRAVAEIEEQLRPLRWQSKDLVTRSPSPRRQSSLTLWVLAASVCLATIGAAFLYPLFAGRTSWTVVNGGSQTLPVRLGQVIGTSHSSRAVVKSEDVGRVALDPNTRLRLTATDRKRERFELEYGTIHALIWAPPAKFVVDTPSASTVDLGCEYTLSVGKNGDGLLNVEFGWVAFEAQSRESFIPAGAACRTRRGAGPDTPYFLDAPRTLIDALARFDANGSEQQLQTVLEAARARDGLTLWHLLGRVKGEGRAKVYRRLAALVQLPEQASRYGVMSGDRQAFDAAWDALQLGDTSWWREWKRRW